MSKRRFWQIHLSTAIILMVLAGAALGLNFVPNPPMQLMNVDLRMRPTPDYFGWPVGYAYRTTGGYNYVGSAIVHFHEGLVMNLVIVSLFLGGVAVVSEWHIRSREALHSARSRKKIREPRR